jgi:hypothetical protein
MQNDDPYTTRNIPRITDEMLAREFPIPPQAEVDAALRRLHRERRDLPVETALAWRPSHSTLNVSVQHRTPRGSLALLLLIVGLCVFLVALALSGCGAANNAFGTPTATGASPKVAKAATENTGSPAHVRACNGLQNAAEITDETVVSQRAVQADGPVLARKLSAVGDEAPGANFASEVAVLKIEFANADLAAQAGDVHDMNSMVKTYQAETSHALAQYCGVGE